MSSFTVLLYCKQEKKAEGWKGRKDRVGKGKKGRNFKAGMTGRIGRSEG